MSRETQIDPLDGGGARPALWVARLLQASDSAYPTGSYAHSWGLEGLVELGTVGNLAQLERFLLTQVSPQLARCELPVAARAWHAAGEVTDWAALERLCHLGRALRGAREPREASLAVGRQRLEMAALLHGGIARGLLDRAAAEAWPLPSCVAAGVEGRLLGAPVEAVLAGIVYATFTGLVTAAVKLLRLGQNAVQALLGRLLSGTEALVHGALQLSEEQIGSCNPWWDIAAARHETADFRLFIS